MTWKLLPTDYTDVVWEGLKKYTPVDNSDGTMSFNDVTVYKNREKSFFGAKDANRMNEALNYIMSMLENGTDLYETFQAYFTTQKELLEKAIDALYQEQTQYFTDFKKKGDSSLTEIEHNYAERLTSYESEQTAAFGTWFTSIKGKLSGDIAGSLQNQISESDTRLATLENLTVQNLSSDMRDSYLIPIHDGTSLKKVTFENLKAKTIADTEAKIAPLLYNNAGAHNAIYRGKMLGSYVTDDQWTAIRAGTFDDLYIGDYWTIGSVNYRIAAFDYYLNTGDKNCTSHHVALVPDTCLRSVQMRKTASGRYDASANSTDGGYVGSNVRSELLAVEKLTLNISFDGRILKHRIYLANTVSNGKPSNGAWFDSEIDLMNENMVYGSGIFSPVSDGNIVPNNHRVDSTQLPLFRLEPSRIGNRSIWWLRDIVSSSYFATVNDYSNASAAGASNNLGIRPLFCIA